MKEDGDEGNTAFSAPEPDEGLQGKINNVLDKRRGILRPIKIYDAS